MTSFPSLEAEFEEFAELAAPKLTPYAVSIFIYLLLSRQVQSVQHRAS